MDSPFNVSIDNFKSFAQYLSKLRTCSLGEFDIENVEKDTFAVSIDDVSQSFYDNGYPILKSYNIPFTIFVATDLLDKDGFITIDELKTMADDPLCTVGSHGVSHVRFYKLKKEQILHELEESKCILESLIGKNVSLFAFPHGTYSSAGFIHKKTVMDYYHYGFSVIPTLINNGFWQKKYFFPRINLSNEDINRMIRENPYMQYMLGLKEFTNKPVFDPSLFVTIRKRIGADEFND